MQEFCCGERRAAAIIALTVAACCAMCSTAVANINLELRPLQQTVTVGSQVAAGLYAVSDDDQTQLLSGVQLVFAWDPTYLTLTGSSSSGAPSMAFSGFPASGHFGLNEVSIPQDGDGFYLALSFAPIAATPAGTLLTTFLFTAIAPTQTFTTIDLLPSGGMGGQTLVASGSVPGLNVTGTLTGAQIQIIPVPVPPTLLLGVLGGVLGGLGPRRRRRAAGSQALTMSAAGRSG